MRYEDFSKNETMKLLGHSKAIFHNSPEGHAIDDIIEGVGLPYCNDVIELCSLAISMGKIFGIREERARRKATTKQ